MTFFQSRFRQALGFAALLAIAPLSFSIDAVHGETPADNVPTDGIDAPETVAAPAAPKELSAMIEEMDQAANAQRLKAFMGFFSKSFAHTDGLSRRQLKQSVRTFWKEYDQLSYKTELESWKEVSPGVYETITTTTISGEQTEGIPAARTLSATVRSQQTIENEKIQQQTILDEQSQVLSGAQPPSVRVNLPESVKAGEEYFFDVIVNEPLGDRILLGAAIEEAVAPQGYLNPSKFEIQALSTGGLFKIGKAPSEPTDQWISALLIQDGGMYIMSQRVTVLPSTDTVSE